MMRGSSAPPSRWSPNLLRHCHRFNNWQIENQTFHPSNESADKAFERVCQTFSKLQNCFPCFRPMQPLKCDFSCLNSSDAWKYGECFFFSCQLHGRPEVLKKIFLDSMKCWQLCLLNLFCCFQGWCCTLTWLIAQLNRQYKRHSRATSPVLTQVLRRVSAVDIPWTGATVQEVCYCYCYC